METNWFDKYVFVNALHEDHVMQLIYFSSSEISDFEFHPPVMDWTRRFSVAFKERAEVCIMTFCFPFAPSVFFFLLSLGCNIQFQSDHWHSQIVTSVRVKTDGFFLWGTNDRNANVNSNQLLIKPSLNLSCFFFFFPSCWTFIRSTC